MERSIDNVAPDWLHCKPLGTDMYFMGSVLLLLMYSIPPLSPDANLDNVWARLLAYFWEHKDAFPRR